MCCSDGFSLRTIPCVPYWLTFWCPAIYLCQEVQLFPRRLEYIHKRRRAKDDKDWDSSTKDGDSEGLPDHSFIRMNERRNTNTQVVIIKLLLLSVTLFSLYTNIKLKVLNTRGVPHIHIILSSSLTLHNLPSSFHLITHRLLPLRPMLLIQFQCRHSILQWTMWHTILLNYQSQLVLGKDL